MPSIVLPGAAIVAFPCPSSVIRRMSEEITTFSLQVPVTSRVSPGFRCVTPSVIVPPVSQLLTRAQKGYARATRVIHPTERAVRAGVTC